MDFILSDAAAFHYPDHTDGITLLVTLNAGGHTVEALGYWRCHLHYLQTGDESLIEKLPPKGVAMSKRLSPN